MKSTQSCGLIIFGASGDLTHRKLIPALFELEMAQLLPKNYFILGAARSALSDAAFQEKIIDAVRTKGSSEQQKAFAARCFYISGDYGDSKTYKAIQERLTTLDQTYGVEGRHLFYLSTPPDLYEVIVTQLGAAGLSRPNQQTNGWSRVVIEKPFGHDLKSDEALNRSLSTVLKEDQIFRIDHYLGKESVQNLLMFRFANSIFEPLWNRDHIDHIQITAAETVGVEHRAGYYEQSGLLRDMFQNHLFQLLSLVAMEPPTSFEAEALRDEKAKIMRIMRPLKESEFTTSAIRAQYLAGQIQNQTVPAYRQEEGVEPNSSTETFAALRVELDNWRWQGVPFYLRSGKRLPVRRTEILVQFKRVPISIFKPLMDDPLEPNILNFRIQPDDGISLRFEVKQSCSKICTGSVIMDYNYKKTFGTEPLEAYARLFLDVMDGDQTLFSRSDWLAASWRHLTPLLEYWENEKEKGLYFYPSGSWGPSESDALLAREGRRWLTQE